MFRTKLADRKLPGYTNGEEIFNMASHIVGGALSIAALTLCVVFSALKGDPFAVVSSAVYGTSLIFMYTFSSIYHGLRSESAKKVMQILDHCMIYFLIGGTYTPLTMCSIRKVSEFWAWIIFGAIWVLAAVATVFTAIDLKRFAKLSMICYILMGWLVVIASRILLEAISLNGFLWLIGGGIAYTAGAVIYIAGKKYRYMHSVFHLFVLAGSILHFFCILLYVIL